MSVNNILKTAAFQDPKEIERDEEFSNFMQRVGHVSSLVKDLASGDRARSDVAKMLADKYLEGKVIQDENMKLEVKTNRTLINKKAFRTAESKDGETDKEAWMEEMSKDAERRAQDRKVRRERADTFKTQAIKAFRRQEYEKALSCYNKAIEQVKDNSMMYCDRALTNIKLGKFDKVLPDCEHALRLHEDSYKARLYKAKAYQELGEIDKLEECKKEIHEMFSQHYDLTEYFLTKNETEEDEESGDGTTITF